MSEGKILAIRIVGDPILKIYNSVAEINKDDLKGGKYKDLSNALKETIPIQFNTHAYGLAAPQVGYALRMMVVNVKNEDVKYNDPA